MVPVKTSCSAQKTGARLCEHWQLNEPFFNSRKAHFRWVRGYEVSFRSFTGTRGQIPGVIGADWLKLSTVFSVILMSRGIRAACAKSAVKRRRELKNGTPGDSIPVAVTQCTTSSRASRIKNSGINPAGNRSGVLLSPRLFPPCTLLPLWHTRDLLAARNQFHLSIRHISTWLGDLLQPDIPRGCDMSPRRLFRDRHRDFARSYVHYSTSYSACPHFPLIHEFFRLYLDIESKTYGTFYEIIFFWIIIE